MGNPQASVPFTPSHAGFNPSAGYYVPRAQMGPPSVFYPPNLANQMGPGPNAQNPQLGGPLGGGGSSLSVVQKDQVLAAVRQQVEYYFSTENLVKDVFLRSKMDAGGWIPLPVIAGFNRIRMMTPEPNAVLEAITGSLIVEIQRTNGPVRVGRFPAIPAFLFYL